MERGRKTIVYVVSVSSSGSSAVKPELKLYNIAAFNRFSILKRIVVSNV
jgi:hypothetical protein